jgi:hypothetical protein
MKIVVRKYREILNGATDGRSDADISFFDAGIVNAEGVDRYGWSFVDNRNPGFNAGYLTETRLGNEATAKIYGRALLGNIYLNAPEYADINSYYLGREDEEAFKYTEGLDSMMTEDDRKRLLIMRSYFLHHISVRQASVTTGDITDFIANDVLILFSHHNEEDVHRRLQMKAVDKIIEVKELMRTSGYKHRLSVFLIDTSGHYSISPGYNLTNLMKYQLPPSGCFEPMKIYDEFVKYFVGYESFNLPNEKHFIGNWPNFGTCLLGQQSTELVGYQRNDDLNMITKESVLLGAYLKWLSEGTLDTVEYQDTVHDMRVFKQPI